MLCHLSSLPPRSVMSEFACSLHCKSSVAALAPGPPLHHGLCTLWTAFTNYLTWILLALVAPFSRGYVPAFVGEYVPFFFPTGFLGFSYRQIHLKSVPAHHRPEQGLRLVIIINYCVPSWQADWVFRIFFHDLGRIHASLFRIRRCSKLMSLGLVVLIRSLTSALIAWLSPQVWLARSTCILGLRQSNWQF